MIVVHNDWVREQALEIGVIDERLYILETRPAPIDCETVKDQHDFSRPWILSPCSFNRDEPIDVILAAARLVPEITFVLTGNAERAQGIHDLSDIPPNVKLPGFLPKAEFDSLLCSTDALLGLTTLDGIQLSVANEAVGAGKPMVISDTKLLKKLFYKGATYVDSLDPESLAQGCKEALSKKNELIQEVCELRNERNKRWHEQASKIDSAIENLTTATP
jgi:glycosyltransferase involved in cell wall biosynthesis